MFWVRRYVRFGSFLEGTSAFDAAAFRLAGGEAVALDPQARLLLEQAAEALAAGPRAWDEGTGVYIGCMYTEYLDSVLGPLVGLRALQRGCRWQPAAPRSGTLQPRMHAPLCTGAGMHRLPARQPRVCASSLGPPQGREP